VQGGHAYHVPGDGSGRASVVLGSTGSRANYRAATQSMRSICRGSGIAIQLGGRRQQRELAIRTRLRGGGIAGFGKWFQGQFPESIIKVQDGSSSQFDHVCFDMNGILHSACRHVCTNSRSPPSPPCSPPCPPCPTLTSPPKPHLPLSPMKMRPDSSRTTLFEKPSHITNGKLARNSRGLHYILRLRRRAHSVEHAVLRVYREIDFTLRTLKPGKSVVLAFDGPGPNAKLITQVPTFPCVARQ
jgi:hypothetical protein